MAGGRQEDKGSRNGRMDVMLLSSLSTQTDGRIGSVLLRGGSGEPVEFPSLMRKMMERQ